jgi:hypothetical protein
VRPLSSIDADGLGTSASEYVLYFLLSETSPTRTPMRARASFGQLGRVVGPARVSVFLAWLPENNCYSLCELHR